MLLPIRCFTCGKPISHLWEEYLNDVQKASNEVDFTQLNYSLRDDQQGIILSAGDFKKFDVETPEFQALTKANITRYCCRRMFLGCVDMTSQI